MHNASIANTHVRVKTGNLSNTKQGIQCLTTQQRASSNNFMVLTAACLLNIGRNPTSSLQEMVYKLVKESMLWTRILFVWVFLELYGEVLL